MPHSFSRARSGRQEAKRQRDRSADLLSAMSHELRTPLNAITGYVSLLEMGVHGPLNELQREDLLRIKKSQERLLDFVNQVVAYARIEAGQIELNVEEVDVTDLLHETAALLYPQLAGAGLQYTCTVESAELLARADREKLRQIVVHLLLNALKYTPSPGSIEVSAHKSRDDEWVEIDVRDTGCGIPSSRLEQIFTPATLPDPGTNTSGVRLGLATSRGLARALGGDIKVTSVEGLGSTFTLRIPR